MKEREEKLQEEIQKKCGKSQEKIFYISAASRSGRKNGGRKERGVRWKQLR